MVPGKEEDIDTQMHKTECDCGCIEQKEEFEREKKKIPETTPNVDMRLDIEERIYVLTDSFFNTNRKLPRSVLAVS